ncbi:MAG: hypothetical protein U1E40_11075 [Amaricoccus sp.]
MKGLRFPRRIRVHPSRSADFKAGHRVAARAAIAWLYWYTAMMRDPKAVAILHSAAFALGQAFAHPPPPQPPSKKQRSDRPTIVFRVRRGRIRVSFRNIR